MMSKRYQIIYADPPWQYKENWGNGSNEHTYPSMSFEEIKKLWISSIADDNAHLYLWVTNPFIKEGLELCSAWGFNYKTLITWVKQYPSGSHEMGMGYYFRSCTEHMIFGVRGKKKVSNKTTRNLFYAINPRKHSQKPVEAYELIERSSDGNKLELFARNKREGWDVWGNEVESDIKLLSYDPQNPN